ncbi:MAG: PAS domain-containing sensor histidine kinase [Thermoanaerobaculum sp.]|nr:PAS domain-containing sensor histidine kinase [Thermoanaerobaculum sp.]MDW7967687.1 ATP-binding protein [Thermoanaerobaculum sp.]
MRSRLRLAVVVAALTFLLAGSLVVGLWQFGQRRREKAEERQLRTAAAQLVAQLPRLLPLTPELRNRHMEQLGVFLGARVTLVAADGTVLADSHVPFTLLPSVAQYRQKPEFLRAMEVGEAFSRRRSLATGVVSRSLAVRGEVKGEPLVVHLVQEVKRSPFPWWGFLGLLLGAAGVGWVAQFLVAREQAQVHGILAPWCELPREAETSALAYEADRSFRRIQDELRRELEACRQALARVAEGVVLLDRDRAVHFANHAAERLLGPLPLGCYFWERCANPQITALLSEDVAPGASRHGEVELHGRTLAVTLEGLAHPLLTHALLVRDISPEVRFEAARRALVADLAHELRTPITVLQGIADELRDRGWVGEPEAMLRRQVDRLSRFARDLEELVQIETGRLVLELVSVDLLSLAQEVVADLAALAQERQVLVTVEGEAVGVVSDRWRLAQVLSNLVDNAIRYNRPKGTVTVRVRRRDGGAELLVEDTGLGIPEADLPLVFQRFYRVRRGEGEGAGSGLGLAIVKHLVARLGGHLHLTSKVGEGTKVWVELPAEPPTSAAPRVPSTP